jgi:hypothetical protein
MRALHALAAMAVVASGAAVLDATPANAGCSVFSRHPCLPTVRSVFRRGPCIPEIDYPFGQDLRLTIESVAIDEHRTGAGVKDDADDHPDAGDRELDTLRAILAALRACWIPPDKDEARPGMQMSVRFAFKRSGEIIAAPRVTYATPGIPAETRETYLHAIMAALERCTPLHFSAGLGGAVAGRPIAIRFVDNRDLP